MVSELGGYWCTRFCRAIDTGDHQSEVDGAAFSPRRSKQARVSSGREGGNNATDDLSGVRSILEVVFSGLWRNQRSGAAIVAAGKVVTI